MSARVAIYKSEGPVTVEYGEVPHPPGTHTEAEARTKWCPFARRAVGFDGSRVAANRWDGKNALCLGSGCMAWIVVEPAAPGLNEEPRGRCGLVGRGG
jgi:hypothetical protein